MDSSYSMRSLTVYPHHIKQNVCGSRAKYRDGRKDRAVKVYTVNQESVYLLISNVPAVGGAEDLRAVCDQYGMVEDFKPLDGYPTEEFTEVYLAKYDAFPSARIAKKHLDDRSFLGGTLHVCYAPEFETVQETRLKLQDRRKYIAWKTNTGKTGQSNTLSTRCNINPTSASRQQPAHQPPQQPVTYIWAGKEYTVHPQPPVVEDVTIHNKPKSSGIFVPRQLQSSLPSSLPITSPRGSYQSQESSSTANIPQAAESSYESTISSVRKRVSKVSVPNVRVSSKRRRRM